MSAFAKTVNIDQARAAKQEFMRIVGEDDNIGGVGIGGNPRTGHTVEVNLVKDDPALIERFPKISGVKINFRVTGVVRKQSE